MSDSLQNSCDLTLFENLPNELFVEIFSYLTTIDAFVTFSNINYRFQRLVVEYCRSFDLTSIGKTEFDIIFECDHKNQWNSLKLSDGIGTPGQVKYFLEKYSFINGFSQLESLSITKINPSNQYLLLSQLSYLTNLVSLQIEPICAHHIQELNLPKLKKLICSSCANTNWLKTLTEIESIEYSIIDCKDTDRILIWPTTLKHLKVVFINNKYCSLIQQSITYLHQLIHFEIYQMEGWSPPHGLIWKQIIASSLPQLSQFEFYFQFPYLKHNLSQVNKQIASFSSSFNQPEKNWLIRCDVSACYGPRSISKQHRKIAALYTVPFPLETLAVFKKSSKRGVSIWSKTKSDHPGLNPYKNIKTLIFESYTQPNPDFIKSNVTSLILYTEFDALDWIHLLTKLRHLTINDGAVLSMENFNILLDNTPHLCSLTGKKSMLTQLTDNWSDPSICKHLSQKIRSLSFSSSKHPSQYFHTNQLEKILPLFSSKCQHLSLGVFSLNNAILFIVHRMLKLKSLHVYIQNKCSPVTIEWLEQQRTPFNRSNCIITIDRRNHYFWFG